MKGILADGHSLSQESFCMPLAVFQHQPGHQSQEGDIEYYQQDCSCTQADRACHMVSVQEHETAHGCTHDSTECQDLHHTKCTTPHDRFRQLEKEI